MFELRIPGGHTTVTEIERKRSRFITWLRRVDSDAEARALVAEAKAEFPNARHHCTAWVICVPGQQPVLHSSDDGEPSGTAGRPMLDTLSGSGIGNIAAVVIRYFGGTLLGTGGLVRAYSDAVTETLRLVRPLRIERLRTWTFDLDYAVAGRIEDELRSRGVPVEVSYGATGLSMSAGHNDPDELASIVSTLAGATIELTEGEVQQLELPLD